MLHSYCVCRMRLAPKGRQRDARRGITCVGVGSIVWARESRPICGLGVVGIAMGRLGTDSKYKSFCIDSLG
jgi:hypothetical protein